MAEDNVDPPFQQAYEKGLVDQPIFTVWLTKDGVGSQGKRGGLITYGGIDSEHCSSDIKWVPLQRKLYWQFKVTIFTG